MTGGAQTSKKTGEEYEIRTERGRKRERELESEQESCLQGKDSKESKNELS